MKRGALIAAVVLAIGAFACERKHDDKAGETTTTSGPVLEEQSTGTGYNVQPTPPVHDTVGAGVGETTGTDRNAKPSTGSSTSMGSGSDTSGLAADQSGTYATKDGGVASDFEKKDGTHVTDGTKTKSGDNKSTTLGDGTSGQYTGGKGTYGGKDTHGTGAKK